MYSPTFVAIGAVLLSAGFAQGQAQAQEVTAKTTQEANIQSYVSLLRQDIKKGRVSILTELMELTPEQAAKFWPIYNEYDKELTKLGDERVANIRMFAENYASMPDAKITEIAHKALDIQARRTDLMKRYFDRMSQAISPQIAGRFLQIESQLQSILDLQIASSLPIVE
jgi:hypothetical protein